MRFPFPADVMELIAERAQSLCEIGVKCGGGWNDASWMFSGPPHHRLPRRSGGRSGAALALVSTAANALAACNDCHTHVERNRAEAYVAHWLLREGEDPTTTPVMYRNRGFVLLGTDGSVTDWTPDVDGAADHERSEAEELDARGEVA